MQPPVKTDASNPLQIVAQLTTRTAYTATIFVSALLLFAVQPMLTKMVLPRLGGSPSVWAVSMCFFQGTLLLGYCYAFLLNRVASHLGSAMLHMVVLAGACLALPIALPESGAQLTAGGSYLWLVETLAIAVGLPFLAVAANAPLLQAWFARSGDRDARDPYFLYRASNAGSLVALLAYPVLLEPLMPLSAQATAWGRGFVLLALLIGLCGILVLAGRPAAAAGDLQASATDVADATAVGWQSRFSWIGLAFIPSGLLVAFTTYITTDVASAPFIWVVPLAVYLMTFIVVFRPSLRGQRWLELAQPVAVTAAILSQSELGRAFLPLDSLVGLVAFALTGLVCHRHLYLRRPPPEHLTEFYLWMSFGGVLGGLFSAIVAPQVFSAPFEYPLLLLLGLVWRIGALRGLPTRNENATIGVSVVLAMAVGVVLASGWGGTPQSWDRSIRLGILLAVTAGAVAMMKVPRLQSIMAVLLTLCVTIAAGRGSEYTARGFFGVHRVVERGSIRLLYHGTTLHGAQLVRTASGHPLPDNEPPPAIGYFHPRSTQVLGLALMRAAFKDKQRTPTVGIVGLGAGAMACHAREGETWRFFEIDPLVVDIARNTRLFTYLSNCAKDAEIVMGDARLTLAQQPAGSFDYLLLDAFSSNAIPAHLLTVEAIRMYLDRLSDRGVLALHVSNRNLDLVSVVAANIDDMPELSALDIANQGSSNLIATAAQIVLIARYSEVLAPVANRTDSKFSAVPLFNKGSRPWTDDFSDVFSALVRQYRRQIGNPNDQDIAYFSTYIGKNPHAAIGYKRRADAYMRKKNYAAAIDDLTIVARLFPGDVEAYKLRGMAHQFEGNDLAAIADLTTFLSHTPADEVALELRGIAYGNLGKREDAIADFRKVIRLNSTHKRSRELLERLGASP